jgi:hypothetical protein
MKIEVDISNFEFAHGRKPRGRGGWAFGVHSARQVGGGTGSFVAAAQTTLNISTPGSSGQSGWLSISPSGSLTTPANITVNVDATGLAAGTISGEIDLIAGLAYRRIPVALTVPVHGNVIATSGSGAALGAMKFTSAAGGTSAAQQVQIAGVSGTPGIGFTYSSSAPWLTIKWVSIRPSGHPCYGERGYECGLATARCLPSEYYGYPGGRADADDSCNCHRRAVC